MLGKMAISEIRQMINPFREITVKFEEKQIDKKIQKSMLGYFLVYIFLFTIILLIVSFSMDDFKTAFSAVAATYNNIGPGLGKVGPAFSFYELTDFNKIVLSFSMLAGRLELFPMLVLFVPSTWKMK